MLLFYHNLSRLSSSLIHHSAIRPPATHAAFHAQASHTGAVADNVRWVNPWVWLGGGSRRIVENQGGRISAMQWNYETINSWMLGAEINNPYCE